jgi:hypothetical protein
MARISGERLIAAHIGTRRTTMPVFEFTLVISGEVEDEEKINALFAAGCADATFGEVDGIGYGEFHREAASFPAAVVSAVEAVETVPGLRVLRVEPDDLVSASEIAARLERTRESVRLLISGERGPGNFPAPVSHLRTRHRLWRWSEVAVWSQRATPAVAAHAQALAALNAALDLRNRSATLPIEERRLVTSLARSA